MQFPETLEKILGKILLVRLTFKRTCSKKHVKGNETLEFGMFEFMQKAKENPDRAYRTININTVKKIKFNGITLEV